MQRDKGFHHQWLGIGMATRQQPDRRVNSTLKTAAKYRCSFNCTPRGMNIVVSTFKSDCFQIQLTISN